MTPAELAPVRMLLAGGEAVSRALVEQLAPGRELIIAYGPTEATSISCLCPALAGVETDPPLGGPLPNLRFYVLDPRQAPVSTGVVGELYIAGVALTRGYLKRPGLTAERFVPDPFCTAPGERMYRSGDLVRQLADGRIEYVGRADRQVKLRGFRIELGEIEARLHALPGVAQAAVLVREDVAGDPRLVAYLSWLDAAQSQEQVTDALAQSLPEFMLPQHVLNMDPMPLNANGKIDRAALPAPDGARGGASFIAPRSPAEQQLAAIWASVLRLDRVGATDHFFRLGGHSLLATRVVAQVRAQCGVELPLRALFEAPVLEALARRLEAQASASPQLPLLPVARDGRLPLSFSQQRLWFLDQFEGGSPLYNVPIGARLSGRLDADALRRALDEIVRRHEVLRTSFPMHGGEPFQQIADAAPLALTFDDLAALPHAEAEARLQWLAGDEAQTPFALATGPLIRARLLRVGEDEHVVLITLHHIISDGWSIGVLMQELAALYAAFSEGRPSPLPALALQYADYAAWQRAWLDGEALQVQLAYWKGQLAGAPPLLTLPTDRPRPAVQSFRGDLVRFRISAGVSAGLRALAQAQDATLFMVLASAFNVLLARYAGQDDVCFGTPIANRRRAELEGLIGFFVNTLVLRTRLAGNPAFTTLLAQVKDTALAAYAHQDVPFEQLVEVLRPARQMSHAPVFQVMMALQNMPLAATELPGLSMAPLAGVNATAKFDLTVNIMEGDDYLYGSFEYNSDLFEHATIERMAGHWERLLAAVVATPQREIAALDMLGPDETRRMLVDWNQRAAPYSDDATICDLLEQQAARTPDAVALRFDERATTYAQLDRQANQLARHLRAQGLGPETLAGICMRRSEQAIVAVLAVLKAGGAYVPLDPEYPSARLSFMLEDSAP